MNTRSLVAVQCSKCGKTHFGTVTEREHFVLCPSCNHYVNAVDIDTLAALKAMPFCPSFIMECAIKASHAARMIGEVAETAPVKVVAIEPRQTEMARAA